MSYLAMSAAPIDNNDNNQLGESTINKKRQTHNRTQKYRQPSSDFNPQKVNSVLQSIHNNTPDDDELGNYKAPVPAKHSENFTPLDPYSFPQSMGAERKQMASINKEGMTNIDNNQAPQPVDNDDLKLQELQSTFMNDAQVREYYRKLVPNYQHKPENNKNYYSENTSHSYSGHNVSSGHNDVLIEKLNYMINLLEEQQDQKTENVTEDVVLYSFLGVFIIFIVDSFTKVGRYVR
jgi:hypothetical protein